MEYDVSLQKIIQEFSLHVAYTPKDPEEITVHTADVNRPGLPLAGFYEHFDKKRLQILGHTEYSFLQELPVEIRESRIDLLFSRRPPAIIISHGHEAMPEMIEKARQYELPLVTTPERSSDFMAALIAFLNIELAPRETRHGVMVEVYGEGLLLLGESGVGKSETAIELVKRGHRLIADDAVEIRRVSSKTLVGRSPDNIRYFAELRGIGIINARRLFGMGAVKLTEKIDMVINLELWDNQKNYDRMGLENEYQCILDIAVPALTIPVKPGRNLAIIIEVAAMNNRQKKLGFNAGEELLRQLGMVPGELGTEIDWDQF